MRRIFLPAFLVGVGFYLSACGSSSHSKVAPKSSAPGLELVYKEQTNAVRYASGVETKDGYVYVVGNKPLLTVYDARTVGQMTKVAEIDEYIGVDINVRRSVNVSFLSNDVLYIHGAQGFVAIRVKNPVKPELLSVSKNLWEEEKEALTVDGNYAYLASLSGLTVVNVANPAMPKKLYEKADLFNVVRDMAVIGTTLYVLDADTLHAFDVSTPSRPVKVELAVPETNLTLARMVRVDDTLYVMATAGTLSILDAAKPGALTLKAKFDIYSYAEAYQIQDVKIFDGRLYFANERDLFVFGLAGIERPKFVAQMSNVGPINGIDVDDKAVYVAADYQNLVVVTNKPR